MVHEEVYCPQRTVEKSFLKILTLFFLNKINGFRYIDQSTGKVLYRYKGGSLPDLINEMSNLSQNEGVGFNSSFNAITTESSGLGRSIIIALSKIVGLVICYFLGCFDEPNKEDKK